MTSPAPLTPTIRLSLSGLVADCWVYPDRAPIMEAGNVGYRLTLVVDSTDPAEHERATAALLRTVHEFAEASAAWAAALRGGRSRTD
jgi:hypothetical protein